MDSGSTNHIISFLVVCIMIRLQFISSKILSDCLKKQCSTPDKIIYFSDGSASHYKNRKNLINLCHHQADFGIKAEWYFSSTSHSKSARDGLGGTVKRLAARASLHRPYEQQIMTPTSGRGRTFQVFLSAFVAQKSMRDKDFPRNSI